MGGRPGRVSDRGLAGYNCPAAGGAMGIRISLPASLRRKAQKYGAPAWGNAEAEGEFEIGYPCE